MKRILKISGIVILLLIAAIIVLPFVFKGKIIQIAKEQANANLHAVVDFDEDIKLNLIKSFPKFYLEIRDLTVANKVPFEGDTIANIGSLAVKLNLMEAIKGKLEVKALYLDEARIYLHVLNDTVKYTGNWDIMIPSEETDEDEAEEETDEAAVSLPVKDLKITNSYFVYQDDLYDMLIDLKDLNLEGKGDFSQEVFDLTTIASVKQTDFAYGGIKYLSKVNTTLDAIFGLDLNTYTYTFKENSLKLNDFELNFDGFMIMPESDIDLDITFEAPSTEFKNLISLIPVVYAKDFEGLSASGDVNFNGKLKGVYGGESIPAFNINLGINKGMFKYPDLPAAINNVFIDLQIDNPDGIIDHTVVNLKKMHVELDKEPFDASVLLKTPESDPYISASINGKIDLSQIKNIVNLDEQTQLQGIVHSDLKLKGHMSDIENERYENFYASGNVIFVALKYFSEDFNKMLEVPQLHLEFSPEFVDLKELYLLVDNSDIEAKGKLTNFIPYLFSDGVLAGNLMINSNYLNLNTLLKSDEKETKGEGSDEGEVSDSSNGMTAVILPDNIEFVMNASFGTLIYDNIDLDNVLCKLILKESKLEIINLRAGILGGEIIANGFYETINPDKPKMKFKLKIDELNVKQTHQAFAVVQKFAPIAKFIEGGLGGELDIESELGEDLKPLWESLFSKGKLVINQMKVQEFAPVNMLANTLQMEKYKNLEIKNVRPSYKIQNGKFYLDSTDFKVDKTKFNVKGWNSLDKKMDYVLKIDIPAEEFKSKSTSILAQYGLSNVNLPIGETIKVGANITGSIDKPKVKITTVDAKNTVKDAVKKKVTEVVDQQKEALEKRLLEEKEKQQKMLEEKARQETERLKQEAEKKRKELEEKARLEAEKKKKQLEEEARKKLKKIFE
ncbi:MAG: AsmA family protein [Bacteroidetes bacterium]|jgi:hypothetical protein|nr:AsmA family protein [Bacteroidota bacterium]MBT5528776.1 AsmA family protein [Cytophagia bacterium]MBT3422086.1 AsmA family protein [Bacteroidota bacterium]MBT3800145.1 AsmA family protein [Bacteroidota bacterium]MBT3935933.1 AsmA family protein [Bacteroidota bacterium]